MNKKKTPNLCMIQVSLYRRSQHNSLTKKEKLRVNHIHKRIKAAQKKDSEEEERNEQYEDTHHDHKEKAEGTNDD